MAHYAFYSKILAKPFDTIEELKRAEAEFADSCNKAAAIKSEAETELEAAHKSFAAEKLKYADAIKAIERDWEVARENFAVICNALDTSKKQAEDSLKAAEKRYDAAKVAAEAAAKVDTLTSAAKDKVSKPASGDKLAEADFADLMDALSFLFGI